MNGKLPGGSHFPDQAVIEGQLLEPISAKPIDAAITNVADNEVVSKDECGRQGAAHSGCLGVRAGVLKDLAIKKSGLILVVGATGSGKQ